SEMAMLASHGGVSPLEALTPVTTSEEVQSQIEAIRQLHVSDALRRYVVELMAASRHHRMLRLGASPRAGLQLLRAARAHAALAGRDHVVPEDVQAIAVPVLSHRVLPTGEASLTRHTTADIVRDVVERTAVPAGR
ncbi:MAG TPA: MoxR family ATPase, partial [Ornithinimicrobium sp.]|nr:MoxR family ATPase [Ornithinimicrobium sp.]